MNREKNGVAGQEEAIQSFEVLQEQGDRYTSVGDYSQAQQCYGKAASLSPDASSPYVGLGVVAFQKDLLDDAEISFRVACRLDPGCSRAYAGMAMIAQARADYEKAFEMYLKCLELDTDNLGALLGLFQTSCQMGSFAKVIHYLKLYLSIHPKDNSVKFTLAALYVREGNFQQSRIILLDILTSDPGNDDAANLLEEVDRNLRAGVKIP